MYSPIPYILCTALTLCECANSASNLADKKDNGQCTVLLQNEIAYRIYRIGDAGG